MLKKMIRIQAITLAVWALIWIPLELAFFVPWANDHMEPWLAFIATVYVAVFPIAVLFLLIAPIFLGQRVDHFFGPKRSHQFVVDTVIEDSRKNGPISRALQAANTNEDCRPCRHP